MAVSDTNINQYPFSFRNSAPPKWVSNTQISLAYLAERAQSDDWNITSSSTSTLSTGTIGANGLLQSANLTGTVSITAGGAVTGTGTSFSSNFVVGDVITSGGVAGRVTSIASNTSMATTHTGTAAGSTYKRGGICADTCYYLYAIAQDKGLNPAIALSTRSVNYGHTLVDLPTTYTKYREIPFSVYLDASKYIAPFDICEGWPGGSIILYQDATSLFSAAPSTSSGFPTTVTSTRIPLTATYAVLTISNQGGSDGLVYTRENALTSSTNSQFVVHGTKTINSQFCVLLDAGKIKFYAGTAGLTIQVDLIGYTTS